MSSASKQETKKVLAVFLALVVLSGLFATFNPVAVKGAYNLDGYTVEGKEDRELIVPGNLIDGEVWVGKGVEHDDVNGEVTVTLSVFGTEYYSNWNGKDYYGTGSDNKKPPLDPLKPHVLFFDYLDEFTLWTPSLPAITLPAITPAYHESKLIDELISGILHPPGLYYDTTGHRIVWLIHQDDFLGASLADWNSARESVNYTLRINDIPANKNSWPTNGVYEWKQRYWYHTGEAETYFQPDKGNPTYWTKQETTYGSFTLSMNWNNGIGLNSGVISDLIFGDSISFTGKNASVYEFEKAYANTAADVAKNPSYIKLGDAQPDRWAFNARYKNKNYWWHLQWDKTNDIKSYWFTVWGLDKWTSGKTPSNLWNSADRIYEPDDPARIDILYEIVFPNPGGNESQAASRVQSSEGFFHRTYMAVNDGRGNLVVTEREHVWIDDAYNQQTDIIRIDLDVIGELKLFNEALNKMGDLAISKMFGTDDWHHVDWNVNDNTVYTATLTDKVGGNHLTLSPVGNPANHQYAFTGVTSREGGLVSFSVNKPAKITGIPEGMTVTVTEIISADEAGFITVTYSQNDIEIADGSVHTVNITNTYAHGIGIVEARKLFDGYPGDWGIDNNTEFYAMVWDVDYQNYLLFKPLPEPAGDYAGTYWCVGNDVIGYTGTYTGAAIVAVPFTAEIPVKFSNLWTWGRYEVHEVIPKTADLTSANRDDWQLVREITPPNSASSVRKNSANSGNQSAWNNETAWNHGVVYSANNGRDQLKFNETQVMAITNRYKHAEGNLNISKVLAGYYEEWGVSNSTTFTAEVWDTTYTGTRDRVSYPNRLHFVYMGNNTYLYVGNSEHGFIAGYNASNTVTEVPFSVNKRATITGLWANHKYEVREVDPGGCGDCTVAYAGNNQALTKSSPTLDVTVTNTYSLGSGNLVIYKKFDPIGFHSEWNTLNNDSLFYARVWDDTTLNYKLFAEDGKGGYLCAGNTAELRDPAYASLTPSQIQAMVDRGELLGIVPFSVNKPAVLMNLWTDHVYRVEEIDTGGEEYSGSYSASYVYKDGKRELTGVGDNIVVTVTNMFLHNVGDLTVAKALKGIWSEYGVDGDTVFYAQAKDVTNDNFLVFDPGSKSERRNSAGQLIGYEYRCVGNNTTVSEDIAGTAGNPAGIAKSATQAEIAQYIKDGHLILNVPFSRYLPSTLTNLWPGIEYDIIELVPKMQPYLLAGDFYAGIDILSQPDEFHCEPLYSSVNPLGGGEHLRITVTNSYGCKDHWKIVYDPNWPNGGDPGGGTTPTDTSDYEEGYIVEVLPGEPAKTGWRFKGWARTPNPGITDPIYKDGDHFTMPDEDAALYAVWVEEQDVVKTAAESVYAPGGTVDYTISYTMPFGMLTFETIRFEDRSSEYLQFNSLISATVDGMDVEVEIVEGANGSVSFIICEEELYGAILEAIAAPAVPVEPAVPTTPTEPVAPAEPAVPAAPAEPEPVDGEGIDMAAGLMDDVGGDGTDDDDGDVLLVNPDDPFEDLGAILGGGAKIVLNMLFDVSDYAIGNILNTVNVYLTPVGGFEPEEPDATGSETTLPQDDGDYRVIYDPNWPGGSSGGGTQPVDNDRYDEGEEVSVKGNPGELTYEGYELIGWSADPNATEPDYWLGVDGTDPKTFIMPGGDITLYAVWRDITPVKPTGDDDLGPFIVPEDDEPFEPEDEDESEDGDGDENWNEDKNGDEDEDEDDTDGPNPPSPEPPAEEEPDETEPPGPPADEPKEPEEQDNSTTVVWEEDSIPIETAYAMAPHPLTGEMMAIGSTIGDGNITLTVLKNLGNDQGVQVCDGAQFVLRVYDENKDLLSRDIISANQSGLQLFGLEDGSIYYIAEEQNDAFTTLGYTFGDLFTDRTVAAIRVISPDADSPSEVRMEIDNSTDLISMEAAPLFGLVDLDDFEFVFDVLAMPLGDKEPEQAPPTGDNMMIGVAIAAFVISSALLLELVRSKKRSKR